jgi:phospholipid/cholesterol/gamma-HCH transport system permease protein
MESASLPTTVGGRPEPSRPRPARASETGFLTEFGELVLFSIQALRALPGSLRYFSEAMRLNAVITRRMTFLLFVMCGFLGASASNFGFFLLRSLGASDFVGIVPGVLSTRQTCPQMFGYVFAGSICCAIAAELGSAKVQQEVAAYESEGVDPMQLLVGTRIIAVLLYVPLGAMISIAGFLGGSYVIIVLILHGNTANQFLTEFFSIIPPLNVLYCTITVALVTLQCVLVATFYGMRTTGGPVAVGGAVARSLAVNLVLLHIVISLAALFFYGGGLGLPIGG